MNRPCINDLLKIAQRNAIVKNCMSSWQAGDMTFEQAMVTCVTHLADQIERMQPYLVMKIQDEVRLP